MSAPFELSLCHDAGKHPWDTTGFIMEPKLDGIRLQVSIDTDGIHAWTRSEHVADGKLLAPEAAMRELIPALAGTVLDGEAVYLDESGAADFNMTARVMGSGTAVAQAKQRSSGKYVSYVCFDIMRLRGQDVRSLPLSERRSLLERVVRAIDSQHVVVTPQAPPSEAQHRYYTEAYGEGSVIKRLSAPYRAGRSKDMLKWKKVLDEDVVIIGMVVGKGKFSNQVGAVVFGQHGTPPAAHKCTSLCSGTLHERGQCSGMDDSTRLELTRNLPVGSVLVVTHNGVLAGGGFRHPQWSHLRTDKLASQCEWTS